MERFELCINTDAETLTMETAVILHKLLFASARRSSAEKNAKNSRCLIKIHLKKFNK